MFCPKSAETESLFSFRIINAWLLLSSPDRWTSPASNIVHYFHWCRCLLKKSPCLKLLGTWSLKKSFVRTIVLRELCTCWSFLQEPRVNHNLCSILVCRRLLAHPGQKAVEFWKQWHLCRVTPVVLHLLGIHHDMAGPLSRQFELTMSGCWQTPFSRLYSTDGVPLFPPTLQSRYWSWAPLDVVLLISSFPSLRSRFYTFLCPVQSVAWEQVGIFSLSEYWELLLTRCLCHLSLLFWLLASLLACAARNVRKESRLLLRDAGSPYPSQDFPLSDQFEDLHLALTLPKASFPSLWTVLLSSVSGHMKGTNCLPLPLIKTHKLIALLPPPFKMPALSYDVCAPSLVLIEP